MLAALAATLARPGLVGHGARGVPGPRRVRPRPPADREPADDRRPRDGLRAHARGRWSSGGPSIEVRHCGRGASSGASLAASCARGPRRRVARPRARARGRRRTRTSSSAGARAAPRARGLGAPARRPPADARSPSATPSSASSRAPTTSSRRRATRASDRHARPRRGRPMRCVIVVVAWLLGEAVGSLAARRVGGGRPAVAALGLGPPGRSAAAALRRSRSLTALVLVGARWRRSCSPRGGAWEQLRATCSTAPTPCSSRPRSSCSSSTWVLGSRSSAPRWRGARLPGRRGDRPPRDRCSPTLPRSPMRP